MSEIQSIYTPFMRETSKCESFSTNAALETTRNQLRNNWESTGIKELGINPKKSYNFSITRFVLLNSAVLAAYRISSAR